MKNCIWCRKNENQVTFIKKAHTIPQNLGGVNICQNVCDECNSYFGNARNGYPSIEAILKDTFGVSRAMLSSGKDIKKNVKRYKFTTSFFKVDSEKRELKLKQSYSLTRGFQEKVCRQMKRGIYKMFLEERERQIGDALNEKFDFMREFARYDLGDYPVIYFERGIAIIAVSETYIINPVLFMDQAYWMKYLIAHPHFYEFEFLGHVFSIATARNWQIDFDNYIKRSTKEKTGQVFKGWKIIEKFNDVDLALRIFKDE